MAFPSQGDTLNEIAKKLGKLDKDLCCKLTELINNTPESSCDAPTYASLCELAELTSRLDGIINAVNNIEITAENINLNADEINLNVTDLETLATQTNVLLNDLLTQLTTADTNHVIVDNFPANYNNLAISTVSGLTSASFPSSGNYHSVSFTVIDGTANFTIGANTATGLPTGFSQEFTASTVIANNLTITGASSDAKIVITTIQ